ncbi:MAG: Bro-N domain-containing protein [Candidatus Omnitrophota bacterium]|nr:Bro-N domain-containing protein [Candidatus Omnitrophota bacterium]
MEKKSQIALFEGRKIRRSWDEKTEKWFFAVSDIIAVLTDSVSPLAYWRKLKERLKKEGSETVTKCHGLKMPAADGKMRVTDMADTETMFRIIQSIPSPKAEPFKLWLARVGYERVEEAVDPELAINRAMRTYLKKGHSPDWINMRLKSIEIRKALTDEWQKRGVKETGGFAILTDDITFAWAGLTTKQYKELKELKKENLRDNMTNLELVLNMLAEASTAEISNAKEPKTFRENRKVARQGGRVAGKARKEIESKTGKKVITKDSYIKLSHDKKLLRE